MTVTNEQILAALEDFKKEHKEDLKDIRDNYVPMSLFLTVVDRVKDLEAINAKIIWFIVAAFLGALLGIIIHPEWLPNS